LTKAVVAVKMTRMISRRGLLEGMLVFVSAVPTAAQPAPGSETVRWQIEAGG
jgi:hypothetical protein